MLRFEELPGDYRANQQGQPGSGGDSRGLRSAGSGNQPDKQGCGAVESFDPAERGQCRGIGERGSGDVLAVRGNAQHGGRIQADGFQRI